MEHHAVILLFIQICAMLAVALVFGQMMRKLHQPIVIGEIIGGIFLGPTIFGTLAPDTYAWLFPSTGTTSMVRETLIMLGMLFFIFAAGLEVNLTHLRQRLLTVSLTSLLGIIVPFSLGFGLVLFLPGLWGPNAQNKMLMLALFIGTALSVSALPVIVRILIDLNLIQEEFGVIVVSAATISDLIMWVVFAVIMSTLAPDNLPCRALWISLGLLLIFFVMILSIGRWAGPRGVRWLQIHMTWPSGYIGVMTVFVLIAATVTETLGTHAIFGAFLIGAALGQNDEERNHAHEVVYQFAISFFAPLYFVSIGFKANFVTNFDLPLVLLILLVANVGKICGSGFGAWISGMAIREALAVGFGLNARGAMEIILASVALEYKLIEQKVFVALTFMALLTSMLSGPIMRRLLIAKPLKKSNLLEETNDS